MGVGFTQSVKDLMKIICEEEGILTPDCFWPWGSSISSSPGSPSAGLSCWFQTGWPPWSHIPTPFERGVLSPPDPWDFSGQPRLIPSPSLSPHLTPEISLDNPDSHLLHFMDGEAVSEKEDNLPQATQLVSGRAGCRLLFPAGPSPFQSNLSPCSFLIP